MVIPRPTKALLSLKHSRPLTNNFRFSGGIFFHPFTCSWSMHKRPDDGSFLHTAQTRPCRSAICSHSSTESPYFLIVEVDVRINSVAGSGFGFAKTYLAFFFKKEVAPGTA